MYKYAYVLRRTRILHRSSPDSLSSSLSCEFFIAVSSPRPPAIFVAIVFYLLFMDKMFNMDDTAFLLGAKTCSSIRCIQRRLIGFLHSPERMLVELVPKPWHAISERARRCSLHYH